MIQPPKNNTGARLQKIASDERGVAAVEFALVSTIFMAFLMGIFDVGYAVYARAALNGALEEAARSASLENTTTAVIDQRITDQVKAVNSAADVAVSRVYYENYDDVKLPEDFTDANLNSIKDPTECFVDRNGNKQWDSDVGLGGRGGAQDVVAFKAVVTYPKSFPLWTLLGQSGTQTLNVTTVLRNQPFSAQAARVGVNICPTP